MAFEKQPASLQRRGIQTLELTRNCVAEGAIIGIDIRREQGVELGTSFALVNEKEGQIGVEIGDRVVNIALAGVDSMRAFGDV
jgi:hypothetical protein